MNIIVFLPMVVLFYLNIKKAPEILSMIVGGALAILIAILVQKASINDALSSLNYGYMGNTGVKIVDTLLNRGGIQEMMWIFSLAFIGNVNNPGLLSIVVILSTAIGVASMGEVYLSIILNGNLYKDEFKTKGLKPEMLSRFLEEGGTLIEVFVPWSTGGAFVAATLGIETFKFAPYAFLNYLNPLISIVCSFLGVYVLWENKPIKKLLRMAK